jgi:hypothetical protein
MKRSNTYKHPTTYEELVALEHERHARRLGELKRAEKLIRAVAPDLTSLAEHGVFFAVNEYSMRLLDCRSASGAFSRSKWALFIDSGIYTEYGDRLIRGFLSRGWIVDSVDIDRALPKVVLRRPKTQVRVMFDATADVVKSLQPAEVDSREGDAARAALDQAALVPERSEQIDGDAGSAQS